jgi:predicted MPP superfamily phosphohydrolase
MTMAQISDMHAGFGNTEPVFEEAIRQIEAIQPDLLVFTGDFIDDHADPVDYPIENFLMCFPKARLGVYAVMGNHESRRGPQASRRVIERSGLHLLHNRNVCLEGGLWLAGIDDLAEGEPDIEAAMAGVPDDATCIMLSHHPRLIEKMPHRDLFILSGHTHGGQFNLFFPNPKLVCRLHLRCRQVAGWYRNGRSRLYVNRGLGVTGKPYRINCPAEISVFRLVPDPTERRTVHSVTAQERATPELVGQR